MIWSVCSLNQILWPLGMHEPGRSMHDLWPQKCVTLQSGIYPSKFGGLRASLSNLALADPLWLLQCVSFYTGLLPTKFGGNRAFLSNLTSEWPQMTTGSPSSSSAMCYTLVSDSVTKFGGRRASLKGNWPLYDLWPFDRQTIKQSFFY